VIKVRILFLSNIYPPVARGGYEQWCQEVATELVQQNHQVCVLTSRAQNQAETSVHNGVEIYRLLNPEVEQGQGLLNTAVRLLRDHKRIEQETLSCVHKLVTDFQPEVAMIWGMWNVPRSVPALVEQLLPGRVAYYLCDYWLSYPSAYIQRWQEPSRRVITQWPKQLLEYPICVSKAVQRLLLEAGVPVDHARIIYGGTQVEDFATVVESNPPPEAPDQPLRLLFAGRVLPMKGVHTAIRAMGLLAEQYTSPITLDIVGRGAPDYETYLRELVKEHHLSQNVFFRGRVHHSEMPAMLVQYDALIFSSEWEEPFARTVLEAMAAGLVVIGTTTGGTGEILVEDKTGLTFPAGNAEVLADQIRRLSNDTKLRQKLARDGRQSVKKYFTFTRMVNQIEDALQTVLIQEKF
jgi:glycosyltransferase involved in cell wall biosynthesis